MPLIYYSGLDKDGGKFHRFDDVHNVDDIYDLAEKNDEELIQLIQLPDFIGRVKQLKNVKIKDKEVVELCRQLAMYLDGGVDLLHIFEDMLSEPISHNMRLMIKKVSNSLSEGYNLSSSLKRTKALPEIVITLVEIGEQSGHIGKSLYDAADYIEKEMEVKSAVKRALIYPSFTLAIMFLGLVFWIAFVIPQVVDVIKTMGTELPIQTQMLLIVSDFIQEYWIFEVFLVVGLIIVFSIAKRFERPRYYLDKLWWHIPILGPMVLASQMSFYFHYFKVLYSAGIPILEVLERLQTSIPNTYFREAILVSNKVIKKGNTLQSGYQDAKLFETIAIRITAVGEQTGNLSKQLELLATIYRKRVQIFVDTLPKILEPVIIVVIGIFFVLFASTLLGPLYEVITQIGVSA